MKKILSLFLILCCMFSLTSCGGDDEDKQPAEQPGEQADPDFVNLVLNAKMLNITMDYDINMILSQGGMTQTQKMTMYLEQNETAGYTKIYSEGEVNTEAYIEQINGKWHSWSKINGTWYYGNEMTEFMSNYNPPVFQVEQGDFVIVEGVYVGNVDKIEPKLNEYIQYNLSQSFSGMSMEFDLTKYDLIITDGKLTDMIYYVDAVISYGGTTMNVTYEYVTKISNYGTTVVNKPANLPAVPSQE